jgi:hypothetical protein
MQACCTHTHTRTHAHTRAHAFFVTVLKCGHELYLQAFLWVVGRGGNNSCDSCVEEGKEEVDD